MPIVKFDYTPRVLVNCLLDSGADRNLFPAQWGEAVGIKIKAGKETIHYGIGNNDIKAYRHTVKLYVGTYSFETQVDFSSQQSLPLLGRTGFFSCFKQIIFNERGKVVSLEY